MDIKIYPQTLSGTIHAIPSKSQAHRLLICAAFADKITTIDCPETNRDIEATSGCLRSLGADILRTETGYQVTPVQHLPVSATLDCDESGSTLRFLLPIVGALGVDTVFKMAGRLPYRPLSPLWEEMERMGCTLTRPSSNTIRCCGHLYPGAYQMSGNISSQFITGLVFALSLIEGKSNLHIVGKLESKPYIDLTFQVLSLFGITGDFLNLGNGFPYHSPGTVHVEGDWSNAAFFLAAQSMGSQVRLDGLNPLSSQGDRLIISALAKLKNKCVISAADIPDLIPILSVVASVNQGCIFTDIERLRLKESDRVASVIAMLNALGIKAESTENTLTVFSGTIHGGIVNAVNDHRIAMSAAIAATVAKEPITILGADCVSKSYPTFWVEYKKLGGIYEQYIW